MADPGRRQEIPVRARELLGEDDDRLYARFEEASSKHRTYRERTSRSFPVILLEPRETGARQHAG